MKIILERFVEVGRQLFDAWVTVECWDEDDPLEVTKVILRDNWRTQDQKGRMSEKELLSLANSITPREWSDYRKEQLEEFV